MSAIGLLLMATCSLALLQGECNSFLFLSDFTLQYYRILAITVASELAHARDDVKGTGTFLPALIDELYHLTPEKIISRAKVEVHA